MLLLAVSSAWACRDEYDFSEEARRVGTMSGLKEGDWMTEVPASVAREGGTARRFLQQLTGGWPEEWDPEDWKILHAAMIEAKRRMMARRSE